jgi:hypothetical protein
MFDLGWEWERERRAEKERETSVWEKKNEEYEASICFDSGLLFQFLL